MKSLCIRTITDLYRARLDPSHYDRLELDVRHLKDHGLLRHAFKYAYFRLAIDGILEVIANPSQGYGFSTRSVKFWQVRSECMKSLSADMTLLGLDDKAGRIKLQKAKADTPPASVSFGIVFSGNRDEEPLLLKALDSLAGITGLTPTNCEVLIVGGSGYQVEGLLEQYPKLNIRYHVMDDVYDKNRFLTCKKKALIFEQSRHDLLVISHTRVTFPEDFWRVIERSHFEVASPKVVHRKDDLVYHYLDYVLTGSYDIARRNPKTTLFADDFGERHLYLLRDRLPYIDGGVTLFDKRRITASPYDVRVAWGEAEDVDMCARLYRDGFLIDYLPEIVCLSQTNKLHLGASMWRHPGKLLKRLAVQADYWRCKWSDARWQRKFTRAG